MKIRSRFLCTAISEFFSTRFSDSSHFPQGLGFGLCLCRPVIVLPHSFTLFLRVSKVLLLVLIWPGASS